MTGLETQPTVRLFWQTTQKLSSWAAVSQAVHTPSLDLRYLTATQAVFRPAGGPLTQLMLSGNPNTPAQTVRSYEWG